jgi:hypothetical protein
MKNLGDKHQAILHLAITILLVVALPGKSQAIEYTSSCADTCNWNEGSSWTGGTGVDWPDDAGDQAILSANDHIVIPAGVTIAVGTTTLATGSNGNNTTIEVNGTFQMEGNIVPGAYSEIKMGEGSALDLNGYNVAPTAGPVYYNFNGSSNLRITINSTGSRGAFLGGVFPIFATWNFVDVSGLADSVLGRSHTSAYTQHFEYSTFSDMDDFYIEGTATHVNAGFRFNRNDIRNPNGGTGDLQPGVIMGNQIMGTAPRELSFNTWATDGTTLGTMNFLNSKGITFSDNIVQNYKISQTDNGGVGVNYTGNMFFNTRGDDEAFFATGGLRTGSSVHENYFYYEGRDHPFGYINATKLDFTNNILEQGGGISEVDVNWLLYNNPTSANINVKNNIVVGVGAGILVTFTGQSDLSLLDISNNTTYVDNRNLTGSGLHYPSLLLTEQAATLAGTVNVYNNLHYDIDLNGTMQDPLVDLVADTADQVDLLNYNNAFPNMPRYTDNVNVTSGKGLNDLNVDPRFVDETRDLASWDASLGGPGTAANAINEMLKLNHTNGFFDANYTPYDAVSFLQVGFTPQASELDGAGLGGMDIGAVSFTADTTAPTLSNGAPSGEQSAGTTEVTLSLSTDEPAYCKYGATANTEYVSISDNFSATSTSHSINISGLSNGNIYTYYIRCQDLMGNINTSDYTISFSIADTAGAITGSSAGGGGGSSSRNVSINKTDSALRAKLVAQIVELQAQIAARGLTLTVSNTSIGSFVRDLTIGSVGSDVQQLQRFLNSQNFIVALAGRPGSPGLESTYFGDLTREALAQFQHSHRIVPAVGYFGPITRSLVNSLTSD